MRASKTVNGVTHYYTYDGLNLIREEWGNNVLVFLYDASGSPVGMQYRNSTYASGVWDTYYYEKNLQGDIVAIYDVSGVKLVSYTYDAWGNFTRTDVASSVPDVVKNNPITYRGYYYDDDLDLYYLATRYYDPETCRFVTADAPSYLGANGDLVSYNLYAYCSNNPVMYSDPTGHFIISTATLLGFIIGAAVLTTVGAITYGIIAEETIVVDISYTNTKKDKYGGSILFDFEEGNIEFYPHYGQTFGMSSGISYAVGKVHNYDGPGSYGGFFVFAGGGYYLGADACLNPFNIEGPSATSITFSSSGSAYVGWDYYITPLSFNYKKWEFNKLSKIDN